MSPDMQEEAPDLTGDSPRDRVTKRLREDILAGRIAAGETLPTERWLAETFGVARGTIRAALKELEREKLIQARRHAKRIATPRLTPQATLLARTYVTLTQLLDEPSLGPQSGLLGAVEAGIFNAGRRAGLHGLLLQQNSLDDGYLEITLRSRPCGVIVTNSLLNSSSTLARLACLFNGLRLPVVVNSAAPELAAYDRVVFDHAAGSALLTDFLIRRGCRRMLRLWSSSYETDWLRERNRGYEETLRIAGLPILPPLHAEGLPYDRSDLPGRAHCYAATLAEFLRSNDPPQGILATTDSDVFAIAAACRLCGIEPGVNLLIVGYDNNWNDAPAAADRALSGYIPPATVNKHDFEAGQAMIGLLLQRQRDPRAAARIERIAPKLVLT